MTVIYLLKNNNKNTRITFMDFVFSNVFDAGFDRYLVTRIPHSLHVNNKNIKYIF